MAILYPIFNNCNMKKDVWTNMSEMAEDMDVKSYTQKTQSKFSYPFFNLNFKIEKFSGHSARHTQCEWAVILMMLSPFILILV